MLGTRVINELQLCLRQPLSWILTMLAGVFGFFVGRGIRVNQAELFSDPHLLKLVGVLCMLAQPWAACLLAGFALYRADTYKMHDLTLVTPLSRARQQVTQVVSLCLLLSLLGVLAALGLLVGLMSFADKLPDVLDLLSTAVKLQAFQLLIGLPATLLFVSAFWWLRNLSPSLMLVYFCGLLWFISYTMLASVSGSPLMASSQTPAPWLVCLMGYLDWFALTALMTKEPDLALIGVNRAMVILTAFAMSSVAFRLAKQHIDSCSKSIQKLPIRQRKTTGSTLFVFTGVKPQGFLQFITLIRLQCTQLFKLPVLWLVGLIWCCVIIGETYPSLNHAEPGALLVGSSKDAINRFMWDITPLFGSILLLYFSDWLTRRDQQLNIAGIVNALPLSPAVGLSSRVSSLLTLLLVLLLLAVLASILCQWLKQSPISLLEYGRYVLYSGIPLAALGIVFLAIQACISSRISAVMLCVLLLILRFTPLAALFDLHHPLLRPFETPLEPTGGYLGYQTNLDGFWAFTRFWALLAALLLSAAILINSQWRKINIQKLYSPALLAVVSFTIFLVYQGIAIQTALSVNGQSLAPGQRAAMLTQYEKKFRSFSELPMPVITSIDTEVDFFPQQRQVRINGQYHLENTHSQPIETLLIGEYWQTRLSQISLNVEASMEYNSELGQRIYQLVTPLQSGQSLTLDFSLVLAQNGFMAMPTHKMLTQEFNYLRSIPYFPVIGYQSKRELDSEDSRRQFGLPLKPQKSVEEALELRDKSGDGYNWVLMDTQISTPLGYQSFTQGEIANSWQQGNRQYHRFVTHQPIRNLQGFIAAPLKVQSRHLDGVKLQVAFLPQHRTNVGMTLDVMAQTVNFLSTHIAPFNGSTLTLVEKPDNGPTGYALPHLLLIGSRVGFRALQDKEMPFSQAYRRVVHETAHQWFGHWFGNGIEQDRAFLVESIVKYIELVILERYVGRPAMEGLIAYERERYQRVENHNRQPTLSLLSAESPHDRYSRATLAFARLRQAIGDTPILAALAELGKQHGYPGSPASSLDFVETLVGKAPAQRELIETLFIRPVPVNVWINELAIEQI
ncbi:hypothetical protein [Microbulbifer epialgicus]|uniref:Peptidase M1 membrane alanine aminopeptidase domain-containing protein n=1 Tax=Microbulbifer epialgicus TaxID=393907 RepID=A0ABV4P3B9_9GAMM